MPLTPCRSEFLAANQQLSTPLRVLVPVWRDLLFDTETAVTAYTKIAKPPFAFLLESVIGGETWARYTFLGTEPHEAWRILPGGRVRKWFPGTGWSDEEKTPIDPLAALHERLSQYRVLAEPGLPRFVGGAVGYFGYDTIRYIERLPSPPPDDLELPDALLLFTDTVVIIDNLFARARVLALAELGPGDSLDAIGAAYDRAAARIEELTARLLSRAAPDPLPITTPREVRFDSSYTRAAFERDVERIREYIAAGDVFQVVLSQRLTVPLESDAFTLYRQLRSLNPSPYLFFLQLDDLALVGSSPEVLVRVEDGRVLVRPIAGTRPRTGTAREDQSLADELLADPKERAEHLMLVDLGRNDVGRVSEYGTVTVPDLMRIERYSHVLHMVSSVEGTLRPGLGCVDVLRACFPAGTVTGAPKVRAMQIIDQLEPVRRGPYAGAVGYFGYGAATMDTAIAIRTLIASGGFAHIQAGAGIVADSIPAREYEETLAKARALLSIT